MKALVLGMGMQGKAVVHDLENSPLITEIVVADLDCDKAKRYLSRRGYAKTRAVFLDATHPSALDTCLRESGADVALSMLPSDFGFEAARASVANGIAFVNSSYAGRLTELDEEAKARKIVVLPEMGLDPGIDLVLGRLALDELDSVEGFYSYGGGLPEPARASDNPLKYKITWSFEGVLKACKRSAVLQRDGKTVSVPENAIFEKGYCHKISVPGIGALEAYPNGNAAQYSALFKLGPELRDMGRFTLRYPGHCVFWRTMVGLGFLDEDPVSEKIPIAPRRFLIEHLSPRLQMKEGERDMVLLRVHVWGRKNGFPRTIFYDLIDYGDPQTGFSAMNRTVGFSASIAAQLVLDGTVQTPGVLSPVRDIPPDRFLAEIKKRDIKVIRRVSSEEII